MVTYLITIIMSKKWIIQDYALERIAKIVSASFSGNDLIRLFFESWVTEDQLMSWNFWVLGDDGGLLWIMRIRFISTSSGNHAVQVVTKVGRGVNNSLNLCIIDKKFIGFKFGVEHGNFLLWWWLNDNDGKHGLLGKEPYSYGDEGKH